MVQPRLVRFGVVWPYGLLVVPPLELSTAAKGSVLTTETPFTPGDPNDYEYTFPDQSNANLCSLYKALAHKEKGLLICGRLGEYKYYDKYQAIARAMLLAERILTDS